MDVAPGEWAHDLRAEVARLRPGPVGEEMARLADQLLLSHLPPGYAEETGPVDAAGDWAAIFELTAGPGEGAKGTGPAPGNGQRAAGAQVAGALQPSTLTITPCRPGAPGDFRLRRAGRHRTELSSLLPVLASFGLVTVEAVPWHFALGAAAGDAFVDDLGLRLAAPLAEAGGLDVVLQGAVLIEAVAAITAGQAEVSPLNRLVVAAGLTWREVNLLNAYCRYRRQSGAAPAAAKAEAMMEALVSFPRAAAALVALARTLWELPATSPRQSRPADGARADGARADGARADGARADGARAEARQRVATAISAVPDLGHDEALHQLLTLVEATTRTNWTLDGDTVALKFASTDVDFLPAPRPFAEIFVWSTWFEGLHLRFGPVARGGIRWSDRRSDLRGEVLGLARAQVKKNSLIVPTGAKGAFTLRDNGPARPGGAAAAYTAFISALLDLTDDVVGGRVVHPNGIACGDGEDAYLVVAADKGTARFSDLANELSTRRGFWLGDAFASGGRNGYDHKALGITAKGTWVAVRRHFRALGMDADREPLRVVGVGDMSGDVFGNGMLEGPNIRLLAAFDHRHIFVDPAPVPELSFQERLRLSRLPMSSWADYDLSQASAGAAVYPRQAKQLQLSAQAAAALGLPPGPLSPPEMVKAVLGASVDLIFFGGVGTFVCGPAERDADVEDPANDDVRARAGDLRARVIAEGANLALTQQARTTYSRRGGRVNTDFVDNAAGVAMSDREVNLKVLLGLALSEGRLGYGERDELLAQAQDEVSRAVLGQVAGGVVALDRAAAHNQEDMAAYEILLADLEAAGLLDRDVEALPSDEELAHRRAAGAGFSRPELAVLVAYARSELARSIASSGLGATGLLEGLVVGYFPAEVGHRYADLVPQHPLYRQLGASMLANEVIAQMGPAWAHESALETGRGLDEVAGAYWAARQVLGAGPLVDELAPGGPTLSSDAEELVRDELAAAVGRLARWCLLQPGSFDPVLLIDAHGTVTGPLAQLWASDGAGRTTARLLSPRGAAAADLAGRGVPEAMAESVARLAALAPAGELASVTGQTGRSVADAAGALAVIGEQLGAGSLAAHLSSVAGDRWSRWELHLLADDLARTLVVAAVQALTAAPETTGRLAAQAWLDQRPTLVARAAGLAVQARSTPVPPLALLALAVRALGALVQRAP